jgi:hypothetical protein
MSPTTTGIQIQDRSATDAKPTTAQAATGHIQGQRSAPAELMP